LSFKGWLVFVGLDWTSLYVNGEKKLSFEDCSLLKYEARLGSDWTRLDFTRYRFDGLGEASYAFKSDNC
jgi:hypothetical protein